MASTPPASSCSMRVTISPAGSTGCPALNQGSRTISVAAQSNSLGTGPLFNATVTGFTGMKTCRTTFGSNYKMEYSSVRKYVEDNYGCVQRRAVPSEARPGELISGGSQTHRRELAGP